MILALLFSLLAAAIYFRGSASDRFFERRFVLILSLTAGILALLLLNYAVERSFNHDEFEHVHSAWYVEQGFVPYRDFYQHHHSLMWYTLVPFLKAFGHTAGSLIAMRVMMWSLTLAIVALSGGIAYQVTRSLNVSLFASVLLMSHVMFVSKSIEIRPDVPQTLFGLISVLFLVRYLDSRKASDVILCGLAASISFLFLQKTILLLAAYGPLFLYLLYRKKTTALHGLVFWAVFAVPQVMYLAFLAANGSFDDYWLTNWKLNAMYMDMDSPVKNLNKAFDYNSMFWIAFFPGVFYVMRKIKKTLPQKVTVYLGLALFLLAMMVKRPHMQYYMPALCLLCVIAGMAMVDVFQKLQVKRSLQFLLLAALVAEPLYRFGPELFTENKRQLKIISYVIERSGPEDIIYDGDIEFNLFRRDLHYFWYSLGDNRGLDTYNRVTNGRFADYDLAKLIREKNPTFISDFVLDIKKHNFDRQYRLVSENDGVNVYERLAPAAARALSPEE